MKTLYTAQATASGGRDGRVETSDGTLKLELTLPKEMGGAGKPGATNPEQLFASGYAACFASAINFLARAQKLPVKTIQVTARVHIGPKDGGGFQLGAELDVRLPELDRVAAEQLVRAAHGVCPYSNATRGNMEVELRVVD